ncbi:MAG: CehA/McbA family metallohydrolase [Desulfobacteraceae bacterium]|jgi:predicted metal-dependent phosphoesterase TrpH
MLKFTRNKLVSIYRKDQDRLLAHGILEDDIYGLEVDVAISIAHLEILSIEGRWKRAENFECPRAIPFLQEAVGFRMGEGFSQRVRKIIGRKACRHFADIIIECCDAAQMAAHVIRWETEKEKKPDLRFDDFLSNDTGEATSPADDFSISREQRAKPKAEGVPAQERVKGAEGMVIDLHVHTSPASPCSSATVDEIIQEAKRIGLDGVCLTDHNHVWNPDEVAELRRKYDFLILRGNEITTDQGDMVVFGLEKEVKGIVRLEDLREEVSKANGFMIAAHPFRGFLTFGIGKLGLTPEKAMERLLFRLVDAVEVMNSKVTQKENSFAAKVAEGLSLPATGGSDAHEVSEVGIYATQFSHVIRDEKDLIEALRAGEFSSIAFRKEGRKRSRAYGSTT